MELRVQDNETRSTSRGKLPGGGSGELREVCSGSIGGESVIGNHRCRHTFQDKLSGREFGDQYEDNQYGIAQSHRTIGGEAHWETAARCVRRLHEVLARAPSRGLKR